MGSCLLHTRVIWDHINNSCLSKLSSYNTNNAHRFLYSVFEGSFSYQHDGQSVEIKCRIMRPVIFFDKVSSRKDFVFMNHEYVLFLQQNFVKNAIRYCAQQTYQNISNCSIKSKSKIIILLTTSLSSS